LQRGDLKANQITLVVRQIDFMQIDHITRRIRSLQKAGFYNYFSVQKFGTGCNMEIGLHLVKSEWNAAVDLILSPMPDDKSTRAARKCWSETKNASKSLSLFPGSCEIERAVLHSLVIQKGTNDYLRALKAIPRNTRLLYVQAVQVCCQFVTKSRILYSIKC